MLFLILTDWYVYEIVDGEIDDRIDLRIQNPSIIKDGWIQLVG